MSVLHASILSRASARLPCVGIRFGLPRLGFPAWHSPLVSGLFSIVLMLIISPPTEARQIEEIQTNGVLRVGTSGDYQPFSLCPKGLESCQGFDIDLAQRMAQDLDVGLQFVRFHWPELLQDLRARKFDIAMSGVTIRPDRALQATFSRPYTSSQSVIVVADPAQLPTLSAINRPEVRLVVNAGGHLERVARTWFPSATLIPTSNNLALPQIILANQAEALLTDSHEAPSFLAAYPTLHALPGFGRDRKAYLLRSTDVTLRDWIDTWLAKREADGFLARARTHWLGSAHEEGPSIVVAGLFALLDLRLALMPAVAAYKREHDLPVEDRVREQALLKRLTDQAQLSGLSADAIKSFFQTQIDLAKQVQQETLTARAHIPDWARGLDLHTQLRPTLAELSRRIVYELDQVSHGLHQLPLETLNEQRFQSWAEYEMTTQQLSPQAKQHLGEALWQVIQAGERQY